MKEQFNQLALGKPQKCAMKYGSKS